MSWSLLFFPKLIPAIMENIHVQAIKFAVSAHHRVNQTYDGAPYSLHLTLAAHYGDVFSHLLPEDEKAPVLAAIWLHDTIEDCRLSYNDIKASFGEKIAELVYAVTNNRGRTRHDRADDDYYRGIVATPYATFVKLCDRLANAQYSATMGDRRMVEVYRAELDGFLEKLSPAGEADYAPLVARLRKILEIE